MISDSLMLYLLLGNDIPAKREFVNRLKRNLDTGLWGISFESYYGKDINSLHSLHSLVRGRSLTDKMGVVVWDIDSLKSNLRNDIRRLIDNYVLHKDDILFILEGLGRQDLFSAGLAQDYPNSVRIFGQIEQPVDLFKLCDLVIKGEFSSALRLFDSIDMDKFSFPQFLGAMRFKVEKTIGDERKKVALLRALVKVDIDSKLKKESHRLRFEELLLTFDKLLP